MTPYSWNEGFDRNVVNQRPVDRSPVDRIAFDRENETAQGSRQSRVLVLAFIEYIGAAFLLFGGPLEWRSKLFCDFGMF